MIAPKPHRQLVMKRMTLVIGTVCSDGLLFCGDTEEGTLGGHKRQVMKLYEGGTRDWALIVATAGNGPLSDMAAKQIINIAHANSDTFIARQHELMENEIAMLYKKYIHPYDTKDPKNYDRQFSLIIGVVDRPTKRPYLYLSSEEILQPRDEPFACAGIGEIIGYYYLDRVFRDERPPRFSCAVPTMAEAERLLQFVMKEAKLSAGFVGGSTCVVNAPFTGGSGSTTFGAGWEGLQPNLGDLIERFWLDDPEPKK
jgi:hypothetical protein